MEKGVEGSQSRPAVSASLGNMSGRKIRTGRTAKKPKLVLASREIVNNRDTFQEGGCPFQQYGSLVARVHVGSRFFAVVGCRSAAVGRDDAARLFFGALS